VFPDEKFEQRTVTLEPSDRLLLVTDGVEVTFGADIATSQQRWHDELTARQNLPAEQFLQEFAGLIDTPTDGIALRDDLTMLVLEVR